MPLPGSRRGPLASIVTAGMLVGLCDGIFALTTYVVVRHVTTPVRLFQGIAHSVLGPAAYEGGLTTAGLGLLMHFAVAHAWATVYYIAFQRSEGLRRLVRERGPVLVGLLYGPFVWVMMSQVVIPLTQNPRPAILTWNFLVMFVGHAVVVGLPIALTIREDRTA